MPSHKTKSKVKTPSLSTYVRKAFRIERKVAKAMIKHAIRINKLSLKDKTIRSQLAPIFRRVKRNASFKTTDVTTWHVLKAVEKQDRRDLSKLMAPPPTVSAGYGNESWSGKGNAPSSA